MNDSVQTFPLSYAQRRLWFLDQLEAGNPFYNIPLAVPFTVPINSDVLERSVNEIVRRHEALRTVFRCVESEPVQIILSDLKLRMEAVDVRQLPATAREAEVLRLAAEMAQRPFDLTRGPLLRVALVQRGERDYVFLLTMHHIISDGWSLGVFWRELVTIYNALYAGLPSPLPELPIQYVDFAAWQRDRLQGEHFTTLLTYWKKQLADLPVLQLPTDRPRPSMLSYRGAFQELALARPLVAALKGLSQREGTTLFMTLLAAFAVLLHRYTSQDDIVLGTYVASRDRGELEDLIGFFVNSLVLRCNLSANPSFRELLARIREMSLGAYAHQELPFEKLVEELQPERDLSRNPLFQVTFQLFTAPDGVKGGGAAAPATTIEVNRGMAIFDLAVNLWEGFDGLGGHIEYSTDLFDEATMARLAGHYRMLLKSIVAHPDSPISGLALLSEAEKHQLTIEWNATEAAYPAFCVHELFATQVEQTPDAIAVVAGGEALSYGELNRRANRLAHRLRGLGIREEHLVAVCVERGLDMVVALLAILKAGGAYVPLDPAYPVERLAYMLSDSGATVLLEQRNTTERFPTDTVTRLLLDDEATFAGMSEHNPENYATPDNLCYVIYTSGSTGRPKGVEGTHNATVNRLAWMWNTYPFDPGELTCQKTALSFVDSIWELFGGLLQGVRTVIISDVLLHDPHCLIAKLSTTNVSRIVLVPSMLQMLLASGIDLAEQLPALRYWFVSGEALSPQLCKDFALSMPNRKLINLYGSSEVAADVLCYETSIRGNAQSVAIGRPIANTEFYVLDGHLELVPIGIPGELHVGGLGLARGYHNRPELTAERFIPSPFSSGRRLYKSGDVVKHRPDGNLEFLGRNDQQVKIRGYRIELNEIENVLRRHPSVRDVVVSARSESGSDTRLVAYIVPHEDQRDRRAGTDQENDLALRWRTVWNETYGRSDPTEDPTFNIIGWNSSYTGQPIPPLEMREWVDRTAERILALRPRRVLEIGCGSGLLLLRIAPHCAEYVGTDFSPTVLSRLRDHLTSSNLGRVKLLEQPASEFGGVGRDFDLIIMNSVVQYFPTSRYLVEVLRGAAHAASSGGTIFIGDVRSLSLLRALKTAVELHHASDSLPVDLLMQRAQKQLSRESELLLDPLFFSAVRQEIPQINQVAVEMKKGDFENELTKFRYDVTLKIGGKSEEAPHLEWRDWKEHNLTLATLRRLLVEKSPGHLAISGLPNPRIEEDLEALRLLDHGSAQFVEEIRASLAQLRQAGVDPNSIWSLANEVSYSACIGWHGSDRDGSFDVVFHRSASAGEDPVNPFVVDPATHCDQWRSYCNDPLQGLFAERLVPQLRMFAQESLPEYMIPSAFMLLDKLPLMRNGKLDRQALPMPDTVVWELARKYVAPRNEVERRLVAIWAEVLNIERIGIEDNFFELGGHSLLATQLVSRIRIAFMIDLPVRCIFESPTVSALAATVGPLDARNGPCLPRISRVSRELFQSV
jgi:amino acid adenylation domain-containing protein